MKASKRRVSFSREAGLGLKRKAVRFRRDVWRPVGLRRRHLPDSGSFLPFLVPVSFNPQWSWQVLPDAFLHLLRG